MRINIAPKLFIGFLIIIGLNAFFVVIVSKLADLNIIAEILKTHNSAKSQLLQIESLHKGQNGSLTIYRDLRNQESANNFNERAKNIEILLDSTLNELKRVKYQDSLVSSDNAVSPQLRRLIAVIDSQVKKSAQIYAHTFQEYVSYSQQKAPEPQKSEFLTWLLDSSAVEFRKGLLATDSLIERRTETRIAEIEARVDGMRHLTMIIVGGISLFSLVFGLFFSRAITNSLRRLRVSASEIAKGDFNFDHSGYPQDEIGDLAQAFFDMAHDLKKAQDELVRSKRLAAIGEIVASVNHEINNPLMIISGNAQFLEMSMEEYSKEFQERIHAILEETERISRVTRKLREIKNPVVEDYTSSGEQMINLDKSSL